MNKNFRQNILMVPVIINTAIFIFLSLLHFYWALGGKVWYDEVLPTNSSGTNTSRPGFTASLIVAIGLLIFALVTVGSQGLFDRYINRKYFRYGNLILASIFLLRAIGDFKFIGYFKTIKWTRFAINDSRIFSPLCLLIAFLSLVIFIIHNTKSQLLIK